MTLQPNSYGSVAGVATYVSHLLNTGGTFDSTTRPTAAQVEAFLDQQSAKLNAWLASEQYVVPVTQADCVLLLANYANLGAAGLCELTMRAAGYSASDQNERENEFLALFNEAKAFICSGALAALGATQSPALGAFYGLRVGGRTATGQVLKPIFRRGSLGNDPTAESGNREPGWTDD